MTNGLPRWEGCAADAAALFSPTDWEYQDLLRDFKSSGSTFDIAFAKRNPKALNAVSDAGLRYALGPYLDACLDAGHVLPDLLESVIFHLSPSEPDGQFWHRRKELLTLDDIRVLVDKLNELASLAYIKKDAGLRQDLDRAIALWQSVFRTRNGLRNSEG